MGGYFLYQGLKIEFKSKISQIFLKNSWEKTLTSGKYNKPWSKIDSFPILKIYLPKLKVEHIVLNDTSQQSLAHGPGFHKESFLPKKGKTTVISMHRDSHGIFLKKLMIGDIIKLQDKEKNWHLYIVNNFYIIDIKNENLSISSSKNNLLLITCYPFDAIRSGTPYRFIVEASKKT